MTLQDFFVGTVAIAVGLFAWLSAVFNWNWSYRLWKARWVESRFGRRGARIFYVILGAVMIALGVAIACGLGPNRSQAQRKIPRSVDQNQKQCSSAPNPIDLNAGAVA